MSLLPHSRLIFAIFFFVIICGCSKKQPETGLAQVSTFAGSGVAGSSDGTGTAASFSSIFGIAVDAAGNVYVTDSGLNQIRKITPGGVVTTLPDNGPGSTNEFGVPTIYLNPLGVAVDESGNIYVTYLTSGVIRKIGTDGKGMLITGNGNGNNQDGVGASGGVSQPIGITIDGSGNIYVAGLSSTVKKIYSNGLIQTFAGIYGQSGNLDGTGSAARFNHPNCVAADVNGNIYIADTDNNLIRKMTPNGLVSTFAGTGVQGAADGAASTATFYYPSGIAVDGVGNVYVSDIGDNIIRKITSSGFVTTIAGNGTAGSSNGVGKNAGFSNPTDIAVNREGTLLYVADRGNNIVRKITLK
jgi:sugar lactone lactonase YvrE